MAIIAIAEAEEQRMCAAIAVRHQVSRIGVSTWHGPELPEEVAEGQAFGPEEAVIHRCRRTIEFEDIARTARKRKSRREINRLMFAQVIQSLTRRTESIKVLLLRGTQQIVAHGRDGERISAVAARTRR